MKRRASFTIATATTAVAVLSRAASAHMLHEHSFTSPFSAFDTAGTRRVPGWKMGGHTRAKMGALRLTADAPMQRGDIWAHNVANLGNEFSFETRFRMSGASPDNIGESIAWFIVNSEKRGTTELGPFFGLQDNFEGIAVVISTDHPSARGDAAVDTQKLVSYNMITTAVY
jgi:Legume-like lectin family